MLKNKTKQYVSGSYIGMHGVCFIEFLKQI